MKPLTATRKWTFTLLALAALLLAAFGVGHFMRSERAREAGGDAVPSVRRAKDGIVELGTDLVEACGVKTSVARAVQWSERVAVYGRVAPNPRATVEVRAPFAGTLRATKESAALGPGQWVREGQILAWLDVRVGPQEKLDLQNRLNEARLKLHGAAEVLHTQQERADRLRKITSQEIVARGQLDDALVLLADAKTQFATAQAAVELWQHALEEIDQRQTRKDAGAWSRPLTAAAAGEITELPARPGMNVEPGAILMQIVDFRRALVRLDIPPEVLTNGPPSHVQLFPLHAKPSPEAEAALVGPAPSIAGVAQFVGFWYEIAKPKTADIMWRPGLQVKGFMERPGAKERQVVSIPAGAVLHHEGRSVAYVQLRPGTFQRREIHLLGREGDRWIIERRGRVPTTGIAAEEVVVADQAQVLLSEEYRREIRDD